MAAETIHSFLVSPGHNVDKQPRIGGTKVARKQVRLWKMLAELFDAAQTECNLAISFNNNAKGEQQNDCRDVLLHHLDAQSLASGRKFAERLQDVTTRRSGLGLFFILVGEDGGTPQIVLARFPADSAISAEVHQGSLDVEFLERVFMKRHTTYKAAVYRDKRAATGFWDGKAVDKQVQAVKTELTDYWIRAFLLSDFRTTGAAGTRRLAVALKKLVNQTTDLDLKDQIMSAVKLSPSLKGKLTSGSEFADKFGLTDPLITSLERSLGKCWTERFPFDPDEFSKTLSFKTVELDNGAFLTADAVHFDAVFEKVQPTTQGMTKYATEGHITNEKLKTGRPA
jgi:hypothetical protein